MLFIKSLVFVGLMTALPLVVTGQSVRSVKDSNSPCVSPIEINSPALLKELEMFFKYIDDYELPIIALVTKGDSSFCYVSAVMSTYDIQQHPPTAIVKVLNRETLLYTGNELVGQLSINCKQYLIRKHLNILHVDKINKERGLPPGSSSGSNYDPVFGKIRVEGDKAIRVKSLDPFPFFR